MKTRLPSMTSLMSFEATARTLSFTKAASELHLTQTAISHQIKNLEDLLGHKLFIRSANNLALTKAGEEYLSTVREVIMSLSIATESLIDQNNSNVLAIECFGMFAVKQLIPRLHEFQKLHPEIMLRIRTTQQTKTHPIHNFDIAIWHGNGNWSGVDAEPLGSEEIFPVCSPALLGGKLSLTSPAEMSQYRIIKATSPVANDEWESWMAYANEGNLEFSSTIHCDHLATSLEAAVSGLGIALGRSSLVEDDLKKGTLIEPLSIRAPSSSNYYLVSPKGGDQNKKTKLFKSWLRKSMGPSSQN
jgi:LysR family glycine cleavage system transcriptional activator